MYRSTIREGGGGRSVGTTISLFFCRSKGGRLPWERGNLRRAKSRLLEGQFWTLLVLGFLGRARQSCAAALTNRRTVATDGLLGPRFQDARAKPFRRRLDSSSHPFDRDNQNLRVDPFRERQIGMFRLRQIQASGLLAALGLRTET